MPTSPTAGRREWTALAVLCLPLLVASMDVSVLFFAVPFIARDLDPSATQMLWIFDIYGFVLAGLLLTMGSIGDRIGRRRLLLIGAATFSAASLVAAYSTSAAMLIGARALARESAAPPSCRAPSPSSATSSTTSATAARRSPCGAP